MGTAFLHGNGGGGNERAVWIQAYPTEAALLADVPRSQTIGVVTGTAITRCCIQPTVPGSTEGWIWIKDNSPTWVSNHLQVINGTGNPPTYVPVFPSGCMQYINGAWKNKIAYFYKGGKWVQFSSEIKYLYRNGETSITWTGTGTDTDTELLMEITHTIYNGGYGDYGRKYSSKPINMPTGFTKLSIKYYCTGTKQTEGTPTHAFVLRTDLASGTWMSETNVVASVSIPYTTAETVATMDVSGSLYGKDLYCGTYYNSHKNVTNPKQYHIKEIWFE